MLDGAGPDARPRDAVCVLTHDPKFDVPAIVGALRHPGRLHRRDGLAARPTPSGSSGWARRAIAGAELGRVMAPIGLDIGARTPEETAVSICAEIIARRTGRGRRLRRCATPLHGAIHAR